MNGNRTRKAVSYQYDLNGNRTGKTLANNTSAAYSYDNASRLISLVHSNAAGLLARFDYALNAVGNRTNKTERLVGTNSPLVRSESYSYDTIDQITGARYVTNGLSMRNVSYQYDPVGNRQQVTDNGLTTGYTANNLNQYSVVDGSSLSYDNKGNLARTIGPAPLGGWSYTYDAQNRLASVSGGPSSVTATFAYDARNRCVARTVNGVTTYLIYDGWSLLEERNASGIQLAKYIHGATIDEILLRSTPTSQLPSTTYYHYDGLGSTIALTDSTGSLVESYQYDAFGTPSFFNSSVLPVPSSLSGNRFLFTGREYLAETGLYDYRNRFYSPLLGRFLQTDPIRFEGEDFNLYRYVGNEPVIWVDPVGDWRVRTRPLNSSVVRGLDSIAYSKGEDAGRHWQFFYDDGSNSGYLGNGKDGNPHFSEDDAPKELQKQYRDREGLCGKDDDLLRQAETNVQERMTKEKVQYKWQETDCQSYIFEVLRERANLQRRKQKH